MATYVQIPEVNISEVTSKTLGEAAGLLKSTAITTLQDLEQQLKDKARSYVEAKVGNSISSAEFQAFLVKADRTLNSVEKTLDKIEVTARTVEGGLGAIEAGAAIAKVSLTAAKILPIPLIATAALALDLLGETIAQVLDIVKSIRKALAYIKKIFDSIREWISRLRRLIQALMIQVSFTEAGLPEGLINYVSEISTAFEGGKDALLTFGEIVSDLDDPYNRSLIDAAEENSIVQIPLDNMGDWIADVFIEATEKPEAPTEREVPPSQWTVSEPFGLDGDWWWSRATVSGETGKAGIWSDPVPYNSKFRKGESSGVNLNQQYENINLAGINILEDPGVDVLLQMTGSNAVVKVNPSQAYDAMEKLLESQYMTEDQKQIIQRYLDTIPTVTSEDLKALPEYYWVTPSGEILTLKIVVDPKSPKIAYRRYVEAFGEDGVSVFMGPKTFAIDNEVLIEEAKVRLAQLFS